MKQLKCKSELSLTKTHLFNDGAITFDNCTFRKLMGKVPQRHIKYNDTTGRKRETQLNSNRPWARKVVSLVTKKALLGPSSASVPSCDMVRRPYQRHGETNKHFQKWKATHLGDNPDSASCLRPFGWRAEVPENKKTPEDTCSCGMCVGITRRSEQ